ncbi:MAG: transcription elongation factor GreA [Alphaproteobacteria bacterium]
MQKVPMTQEGYDRMVEELKQLKTIERPSIIKAIAEARGHGDLSENAEYHAARERQGFIEGRVAELEDKVSRAEVIAVDKMGGDSIKFGASVVLIDEDTDQESRYRLVGEDEADIRAGLLSVTSPLGRALIGKTVGDTVEVTTPRGHRGYEIKKITY